MAPEGYLPRATRRSIVQSAGIGWLASAASIPTAAADTASTGGPLSPLPIVYPKTDFVYESIFELDPVLMLGQSPLGERRIVPITGGVFQGPKLKGKVLPGGADRQLWRKDGVHVLNALYELQTDDG